MCTKVIYAEYAQQCWGFLVGGACELSPHVGKLLPSNI